MAAPPTTKPKRHKKRKSRTQVSDSETEEQPPTAPAPKEESGPPRESMSDAQVTRAFTQYYTRQATLEFAEDLDRLRGAEDFKEDALALLVQALQQGTALFSMEEQRRVVMGEMEAESGREKGSAG